MNTKLRSVLVSIGSFGGAVAFIAVAGYTTIRLFGHESHTLGRITISSPEVFTRERLVNDRYQQDAWLRTQLRNEIKCSANSAARTETNTLGTLQIGTKALAGEPPKDQPSPKTDESAPSESPRETITFLDWDCFEEAIDYREQIRSLLIENQLDDRHDLNGTSLFKLKFDIAVVPGRNTEALAIVDVSVSSGDHQPTESLRTVAQSTQVGRKLGDGSAPEASCPRRADIVDLGLWQPIYAQWIESIERRLNQTQKEQRQRYENNSLTRSDYLDLVNYLKSRVGVTGPDSILHCEIASTTEQERAGTLPLELNAHNRWKQCLSAIVNSKSKATDFTGNTKYVFQYPAVGTPSQLPGPVGPAEKDRASAAVKAESLTAFLAQGNLDSALNDYFARRSILLVLGIDEPLLSASGLTNTSGSTSIFDRLLKLSFVDHSRPISLRGSDAATTKFRVMPRTYRVVAIDKRAIDRQGYDDLVKHYSGSPGEDSAPISTIFPLESWPHQLRGEGYDTLHPRCGMPLTDDGHTLSLWDNDIGDSQVGLEEDPAELRDYPVQKSEIQKTGVSGVYTVLMQTGLYNFVSQLQNHAQPYTYSVAPQENGMLLHLQHSDVRQVNVGAKVEGKANAQEQMASQDKVSTDEMRHVASIVGFGATDIEGSATFGWVINPQDMRSQNGKLKFSQSLKKYAVSALVSVPSWWRSLSIKTRTAWRDQDGNESQIHEGSAIRIEIPSDFEAFESTVLGSQGPEIDESALDPILLIAGSKNQKILIPGRRLWRSTEVTLGDEPADSIAVLPNMKGVIATFDTIADSSTPDEKFFQCSKRKEQDYVEIKRTVRVWTSQGAVTLPQPATVYVLGKCSGVMTKGKVN